MTRKFTRRKPKYSKQERERALINFLRLQKLIDYEDMNMIVRNSVVRQVLSYSKFQNSVINRSTVFHALSTSSVRSHSEDPGAPPGTIPVKFILKDGGEVDALGRDGEIALRLAQRYDVPMEGACEASLACTTCHCYVEDDDFFDKLSEATEEEEDLLDKAPFLSTNSRLGCQIIISDQLSGIRLRLPRATANFYVDGHVPQPH